MDYFEELGSEVGSEELPPVEQTDAELTVETVAAPVKRRGGRKPMSPEQKEAAARQRAEEKERADNMKPEIYVQFQGLELDVAKLLNAAREAFHQEKKRTLITSLRLYVKPEENAAYYVINEQFSGKVSPQENA